MPKKKKEKRRITFYKVAFGLTPTFRVLIHPEVIRLCIEQQLNLRDQLPKVLGEAAVPATTKCIIHHLRSHEQSDQVGSAVLARKFNMVPCSHQKVKKLDEDDVNSESLSVESDQILSPDACICDILSESTPSLEIATSITEKPRIDRSKFYKIPFIQLKTTPYLFTVEEIPQKAQEIAQKKEEQSRQIPKYEKKLLHLDENKPSLSGKKRKRKQGPNPLSCKKKKTAKQQDISDAPVEKKRKTRRRKKPKKASLVERSSTTIQSEVKGDSEPVQQE